MRFLRERKERLGHFTEKWLKYCGWKMKTEKYNYDNNHTPSYIMEKESKKYFIEVRYSIDYEYPKMEKYINMLKDIKDKGFEVILVIYDIVKTYELNRLRANAIVFDISNVLYILKDSSILTNELMSELDYSVENINIKKPELDINLKEKPEKNNQDNKIETLQLITAGKKQCKSYEKFCTNTLKYLFLDKLDLWEEQHKTEEGMYVFDLICKIKNNVVDDFFGVIEEYFKSKYIIFEFKNYTEAISQSEVCTTEKYLYQTALRKVAIIITRNGINVNGEKMIKGILRETGKLILVLNDEEVKEMIKLKEKGENPSIVLMNKLDFLLIHLEK